MFLFFIFLLVPGPATASPASSVGGTLDLADITPATNPITSYNYATQAYVTSSIADPVEGFVLHSVAFGDE